MDSASEFINKIQNEIVLASDSTQIEPMKRYMQNLFDWASGTFKSRTLQLQYLLWVIVILLTMDWLQYEYTGSPLQ